LTFNPRGILKYYGLQDSSVVLFFISSFLIQSVIGALNVILNLYIVELGFSEDFAGMLLSVKLFTTGFACIPVGMLCARWGVRRALFLACVLLGLGVLVLATTANPYLLCVGAVLVGAAQATKSVSLPPFLVEHSTPRNRQNIFSLNFALVMFANMAGNALSGQLPMLWVDPLAGFSWTLSLYGLLALVAILPLSFIVGTRPQASAQRQNSTLVQGFKLIAKDRNLAKLLLCHATVGFGAGLIVPLFNIFMSNKLAANSGQIGIIMSVGQVFTALGSLLVPLAVTRWGKVKTLVILRFASVPFLLFIANLNSLPTVGAAYLMRTALMNMTNPVESNFVMEMAGSRRRVEMSSLISTMNTATRGISVLVGGWLMANFSYNVPYYLTTILYAITFGLQWVWFKSFNRQDQAQAAS